MTILFATLWWLCTKGIDVRGKTERFNIMTVLSALFRVRQVRLILLSGLLAFGIMHGYFAWLPKILETYGMSPAQAGLASALPFMTSIPSVLLIPRYVPQSHRGLATGCMALLAAISICWVVVLKWQIIVGLLLFGISGPCLMPLLVLNLMETPEVAAKYLGSATGVFFCVAEIGGFFGPFIVGYLVDLSGGFVSGALFLMGKGVLILLLMIILQFKPSSNTQQ